MKNLLVFTSCCPLSAGDPTSNDRSGSSFIHTARNDPVELDVRSYSFSKLNVGGASVSGINGDGSRCGQFYSNVSRN